MPRPRLLVVTLVLLAACAPQGDRSQGANLSLPDGDSVVRAQPGVCEEDCFVSDPVYESVTEVAGRERSDVQLGRALDRSLAKTGWREVPDDGLTYGADQVHHPTRWQRERDGVRSYLSLFPSMSGSYALAYDQDGDSLPGG